MIKSPVLQYKIPQNVGIEDKIVGPFSLRQLIILAIGTGISYVLFTIASRIYELNFIEYAFIGLPAIFALALAMIRVHNVSFGKFIMLTIEFIIKPKKRMWDHRGISALVAPDLTEKKSKTQNAVPGDDKNKKNVNLRDLSSLLDSGGFEHIQMVKHEDIDKVTDDDLITEAYFGHKKKESSTENMYWRTREVQKKKLDLLAQIKSNSKKEESVAPKETPPVISQPPIKVSESDKKESVVEHLANVIKTAREKNLPKDAIQKTANEKIDEKGIMNPPKEMPKIEPGLANGVPKKKRRRRKKKPKLPAEPIRKDTLINNTSKSEPVKLIEKNEIVKKNGAKEGETSFNDLSQGGEIEINLD